MQAEGGDNFASVEFFSGLQEICMKNDVSLCIDEAQTGCGATGKFWAHEHFNFKEAPDIVAFSKKMLTGGFYYKDHYRPHENKYPDLLSRLRGIGTYGSIDLPSMETRDKVMNMLRAKGVHTGGCGEQSIRFRPTLTLEKHHVDIFLDTFNCVLGECDLTPQTAARMG